MKLVTAAIILKDDSILLTRRKAGEKLAGFWEFPGGKIEEGETPQVCLERELYEELGVRSRALEIIAESVYTYDHGVIKLIGIKTELHDDSFRLSVHDKAAWVPMQNILNYKLAPADIPIAEKILNLI